jgi:hypothetical protein
VLGAVLVNCSLGIPPIWVPLEKLEVAPYVKVLLCFNDPNVAGFVSPVLKEVCYRAAPKDYPNDFWPSGYVGFYAGFSAGAATCYFCSISLEIDT